MCLKNFPVLIWESGDLWDEANLYLSCIECDELLVDKRKRDQFVRLAQEVELELSVVGDHNKLYRESLTVQHDAMKKVIDVLLV